MTLSNVTLPSLLSVLDFEQDVNNHCRSTNQIASSIVQDLIRAAINRSEQKERILSTIIFSIEKIEDDEKIMHVSSSIIHPNSMFEDKASMPPALEVKSLHEQYSIILPAGGVRLIKKIGRGSYGCTFEGLFFPNNQSLILQVAIKVNKSSKDILRTSHAKEMLQKEALILRAIAEKDPQDKLYFARYITHGQIDDTYNCFLQNIYGLNLKQLKELRYYNRGMDLNTISMIAKQLLKNLCFLRQPDLKIIHCDIKPTNILIEQNAQQFKIRLIDFGGIKLGVDRFRDSDFIATKKYSPPEAILKIELDETFDIWSLGCTLFELATNEHLFPSDCDIEILVMMQELMGPPSQRYAQSVPNWHILFDEDDDDFDRCWISRRFTKSPALEDRKELFDRLLNTDEPSFLCKLFFDTPSINPNVKNFKDFLELIFQWRKEDRPLAQELLLHPFITSYQLIEEDI